MASRLLPRSLKNRTETASVFRGRSLPRAEDQPEPLNNSGLPARCPLGWPASGTPACPLSARGTVGNGGRLGLGAAKARAPERCAAPKTPRLPHPRGHQHRPLGAWVWARALLHPAPPRGLLSCLLGRSLEGLHLGLHGLVGTLGTGAGALGSTQGLPLAGVGVGVLTGLALPAQARPSPTAAAALTPPGPAWILLDY